MSGSSGSSKSQALERVVFTSGLIKAGTVRDLQGKEMTREEAEALASAAGPLLIILSQVDARL